MKILIGYPAIESEKGVITLGQNRQAQYFSNPTLILPIVPASAATLLKEKGYEVHWKDAIAEGMSESEFFEYFSNLKPDYFMFETKTPVIKKHWKQIDKMKELVPSCKIILCGDHVTALPKESMKKSEVDYVITGGDYDFLIYELLEALKNKVKIPKGVYYREDSEIKNNGPFELKEDLDSLPFIDRELVKWWLYDKEYNIKVRPFAYIMSGRDCPYGKCRFCSWTTLYPSFRVRSVENVLDEIGMLIEKYKIKEIFDDSGTFPPGKWLENFCEGFIERGYNKKIKLSCNMRVDFVTEESARIMKKANFRLLKMGLESGNQGTLDKINKGIKLEQIKKACEIAKRNGLEVHLTMIVGYPWETKGEALNTLSLAKKLMQSGLADVLQSTVVVPYPGTPLNKEAIENDWFLFDRKNYERYDMSEPVLKTEMKPEEVMEICNSIYSIFTSPKYVLRHLKKMRSLSDVAYTFKGVKAILGHKKDFNRNVK